MNRRLLIIALALLPIWVTPTASAHRALPLEIDGEAITRLVTVHPMAPVLAVASEAAVYLGDGATWDKAGTPVAGVPLVWAGGDTPNWLAGDHPSCMMGGEPQPLQRSSDGAVTWQEVPDAAGLRPLVLWPGDGVGLASACDGVRITTDFGETWSPLDGLPLGFEVTSTGEVLATEGDRHRLLVGMTGEGGTTSLHAIDATDPAQPVIDTELRMYFGVGALAGVGDTYVVGAMDGVWVSPDAGKTWERQVAGIESLVLEADPAEVGLPEGVDPRELGVSAVAVLPGEQGGLVIGTNDGLYLSKATGEPFTKVDGTSGRVDQIQVSGETGHVLYQAEDQVFVIDSLVPAGS